MFQGHGWEKPTIFITCKEKALVHRKRRKTFFQHDISLYTACNSTKRFCLLQKCLQKSGEESGRENELFLHLQNGAPGAAVLSTADAAELHRRAHAGDGQALLVEHVPAVEDQHVEGFCCI